MRFRNHAPATVLDQTLMENLIDQPYREVELCAKIMAGGPLVVTVGDDELAQSGYTYFDSGLIVIRDSAVRDGLVRTAAGDPISMLKHEFVHYLLAASGFPDDLNATHQSPLFMQCAGI